MPFKLGLGGPFGRGQHWMSWIHRDDLIRLISHCIARPDLSGPVNGTAPQPVRNREFVRSLGKALRRPAFIPVPALPLKLALGQFAEELLLGGQRVHPARRGERLCLPLCRSGRGAGSHPRPALNGTCKER